MTKPTKKEWKKEFEKRKFTKWWEKVIFEEAEWDEEIIDGTLVTSLLVAKHLLWAVINKTINQEVKEALDEYEGLIIVGLSLGLEGQKIVKNIKEVIKKELEEK